MKLVLASNNQGKLHELKQLLDGLAIELVTQSQFKIASPAEPHCTFVENALLKARHASQLTQLPALADDAGICIQAFDGAPGVMTADYALQFGYPKSDDNNVRALLENMQNIHHRAASMISTLVAIKHANDPQPLIAIGRVHGRITRERIGHNGFGFDPIFEVAGTQKTFAQMDDVEKNNHSHRGKACLHMRELLTTHWLSLTP